jgi:hypothetical protein
MITGDEWFGSPGERFSRRGLVREAYTVLLFYENAEGKIIDRGKSNVFQKFIILMTARKSPRREKRSPGLPKLKPGVCHPL